eukprot:g29108.t1
MDHDLIGTASYDGYVKLWRISTHESVREMHAGKEQLLYGLAFGPGAAKVCCVSSTGLLLVFKVDTGENVVRQQVHTGQAFRCEWSTRGPHYIATGGNDGYACVLNEKDGSVVYRLSHPSAVFGVSSTPNHAMSIDEVGSTSQPNEVNACAEARQRFSPTSPMSYFSRWIAFL